MVFSIFKQAEKLYYQMRFLLILFAIIPTALFSRSDTIAVSDLDKKIFRKSEVETILIDGETHPINYYYSNVFKYHHRLFTGVAVQKKRPYRNLVIELKNGRIEHLREMTTSGLVVYRYDRIGYDSLLAIDSSFYSGHSATWFQSNKLYREANNLRLLRFNNEHDIYNAYFPRCITGGKCTNDGWGITEVRDGYQREQGNISWSDCVYQNGVAVRDWRIYYPDSSLRESYFVNAKGKQDGPYEEYWPNGVIKTKGVNRNSDPDGKWQYYFPSGSLARIEWYSFPVYYDDDVFLDSAISFFENGRIQTTYRVNCYRDSCEDDPGIMIISEEWSREEVRKSYYQNGNQHELRCIRYWDCNPPDPLDTLVALWYESGSLCRISFVNGDSREYYAGGQPKSTGISWWWWNARNGIVQCWDSTGALILDRTYSQGRVLVARDSNNGRIDTMRKNLGKRLAGAAVIGCFPENRITAGNAQPLSYYKANIPTSKDSMFIPVAIVDSLSYTVAGAFLSMPDSLRLVRDSMFEYAMAFHPSPDEWYYTVYMYSADTLSWKQQCDSGNISTGNNKIDEYFRTVGSKVMNRKVGQAYSFWIDYQKQYQKHWWCSVMIKVPKPLNFVYFQNLTFGTFEQVQLHCGSGLYHPFDYRLVRHCKKVENGECREDDFVTFSISRLILPEYSNKIDRSYHFYVNSDQTVDFKGCRYGAHRISRKSW